MAASDGDEGGGNEANFEHDTHLVGDSALRNDHSPNLDLLHQTSRQPEPEDRRRLSPPADHHLLPGRRRNARLSHHL